MKKGQRYQRIQEVGDENVVHRPYHDDPDNSEEAMQDESVKTAEKEDHPLVANGSIPVQRTASTQSGSYKQGTYTDHPLQRQPRGDGNDSSSLRMRRTLSPSPPRPQGKSRLSNSRQSSFSDHNHTRVEIEGDIEATLGGGSLSPKGASSSNNIFRSKDDKDSNNSEFSEDEIEEDLEAPGGGSRGESAGGLFTSSNASSFDLLDDDDEVDLQRYHLDFSASPYASGLDEGDMDKSHNMYHPRSDTNGTFSKDPWIRLENQQSPTHGTGLSLSNVKSFSDFLLFMQAVRRQARQRRAQRLLTMPSEQWSERLQFCFMTYCWDATDVGLLVIAILLVIWLTGLLWLARMSARQESNNESQNGAEYNGNAEFDDYSTEGNPWYSVFQWWWWALGFVLLIRILGPFVVHNLNNRRRQRRRRRFESDNMQRMQQQESSMSNNGVDSDYGQIPSKHDVDDSMTGVEIMPTNTTNPPSSSGSRELSSSPVSSLEIT